MEYNINPPKHSQKNEADAKPSNTETRGTNYRKKERPHRSPDKRSSSKEVHHQKYINSKIPISEKNVIPTTSKTELDTTASSPSNPPSVTTPNTKSQIH